MCHGYIRISFGGPRMAQDIEINIFGYLNCDVGATTANHHTYRLLEICNNFQYKQLIEQQTRITKHTATMHYRSIFD